MTATATPDLRSLRASFARRILRGAALLGILADPLLREEPWGVGLVIWMVVFVAVILVLLRQDGRPLSAESAAWLAVAVIFAAGLAWRDADLLQFFDVLAMLAALVLLAMNLNVIPVPTLALARVRDLIHAAAGTGIAVAVGAIPLLLRDAEFHGALRPASDGKARRIGRALAITVPLLAVFTALLANADPLFGSFFRFPNIDISVVVPHIVVAGFFAWVVAGWLRRAFLSQPDAEVLGTPFPVALGATDVAFALGALNVLFAAFVIVQVGWLFGGEALVLKTTGLSYAAYARRGFFELTAVAGLLLTVLLGTQALIPASAPRTLQSYRRLALPLVILLGAMMVSAGARMKLYIQYYGISTDRLYAIAFMAWLAIVFVWLALTLLRSRRRTFATGLVASGFIMLLALNCLNPEEIVARENLARGPARSGVTGADFHYLASLGGNAVPKLVSELTAPTIPADSLAQAQRCDAARTLLERWSGIRAARMVGNWAHWNAARNRGVESVRVHEAELRQLACPAGKPGA